MLSLLCYCYCSCCILGMIGVFWGVGWRVFWKRIRFLGLSLLLGCLSWVFFTGIRIILKESLKNLYYHLNFHQNYPCLSRCLKSIRLIGRYFLLGILEELLGFLCGRCAILWAFFGGIRNGFALCCVGLGLLGGIGLLFCWGSSGRLDRIFLYVGWSCRLHIFDRIDPFYLARAIYLLFDEKIRNLYHFLPKYLWNPVFLSYILWYRLWIEQKFVLRCLWKMRILRRIIQGLCIVLLWILFLHRSGSIHRKAQFLLYLYNITNNRPLINLNRWFLLLIRLFLPYRTLAFEEFFLRNFCKDNLFLY